MADAELNAAASRVLLTGATGYVGGRLLLALEGQGYRVRCLARRPGALEGKVGPATEVVAGDVLDRASLDGAFRGVEAAYYLIHSMGSSGEFEMIRSLVERLPIMITPKWVKVPAQPIAVDDVLAYLVAGLELPVSEIRVYEIGGADRVSYAEIMLAYARARGIRMRMIPVPVLTPYLSSLWLGLVTPLYARIGRKLIESIVHSTVVRDDSALRTFAVRPVGVDEAIRRAISFEDREFAATRWSDALSSGGDQPSWGGVRFGSRLVDSRTLRVAASAGEAFAPIRRIGGDTGWYAWKWLWRLRGFLDLLVGGVGLRRGRPSPKLLSVGDTVDFWRVEAIEPLLLRLVAEMRLPGRAWLEFEVTDEGDSAMIRQTAMFDPVGVRGRVYWYALWPVHQVVFGGMLRGIGRAVG